MLLCELHPRASSKLKAILGADPRAKVFEMDALRAFVPPVERRGLVLIHPPHEEPGELGSGLIMSAMRELQRCRRSQEVTCQPVMARGDTPEVLQSTESVLAASSFPVKALADAEWLLSVAAVRKDWPGSAIFQPLTQFGAVMGLVADEALRCFACGDEPFWGAVIRFAAGQEDGEKAAPSIRECRDLRVAPASCPPDLACKSFIRSTKKTMFVAARRHVVRFLVRGFLHYFVSREALTSE
jgi:hypothetical protein